MARMRTSSVKMAEEQSGGGTAEKFLAEYHGVRHKKQDGVLFLTSVRFAWDSGSGFQVNHPYSQVKAQRVSSESSSKVQLQLILVSETQLNFHFTGDREKALTQRNQCKELLQRLLQQTPQDPDLQTKSTLLNNTPGLHQLYRELVMGGLITAEEFWENRLAAANSAKTTTSTGQESGLPSAFLAELEAVSDGSDGCNAMKLSVTHEVIEAIFRTYPAVKTRHRQLVPDKMKEEEFWIQFFQSQRFHRDLGPKHLLSSCLAEEEKRQRDTQTGSGDILNSTDSPEEGYSIFPPPPNSSFSSSSSSSSSSSAAGAGCITTPHSLIQRCNLHSSMVLKAISSTSSGEPGPQCVDTGEGSGEQQEMRLRLTTPNQTSDSNSGQSDIDRLANEVMQWAPQQTVNYNAMYSAVSHLVPGGSLMTRGGGVVSSQLSTEIKDQLYHHQMAVNELLRHFWACFPIINPQLGEKAQRMSSCLRDYSEKLKMFATDSVMSDSQIISHLLTSIQIAMDKYETWQNRRTKI